MDTVQIPKVLPIVPTKNKILWPNSLLRLHIEQNETVQLMQKLYRTVNTSKYIVGCVPNKPPPSSTSSEQSNAVKGRNETSTTDTLDKSPGTLVPNVENEMPPE